ncbi:hypothetical protein GH714_023926 [Hevea brasiliensis]|uniref:Protein MON2 homolog n=1 Tax=Hevea brasiliensis TaxID=3981 RepID=A0A6A6LE03_HEVBR|nr:hypothetical protein GH714_023926 [Hevea brasiliensis]
MAFMAVLESDLRALSAEARRRYPAVKDGAEHAILKLRSLSSPSEIAHNEDILRIFLMACEVRTVKLSVIGLSCLQKLISHDAVAPSALKEILSTLKDHAEMADESVQLKTLQTILIIFQSRLHPENEENMAQALYICLRLLENNRSSDSVRNTAAATFRQAVALIFDHVVHAEALPVEKFGSGGHISRSSSVTGDVSRSMNHSELLGNEPVSGEKSLTRGILTNAGKLGLRLLEDLTALAAGGSAIWLHVKSLQRIFALDILEFILSNYAVIFKTLGPYEQVMRHQICSLLMTSLRTNAEIEGEAGEPSFRRLVLRSVAHIIRLYSSSLITECEVFLSMLVKVTFLDLPLWHRILVLEILRGFCVEARTLKILFQNFDMHPKNTNVVEGMVKALARVVSNVQVQETSEESLAAVAGMFSSKAKGIEWSLDNDASNAAVLVASEAHAITLAVEGLLGVVFTVATLTDEAVDVGRSEYDSVSKFAGKTAVLCVAMVDSLWLTILDALSLILSSAVLSPGPKRPESLVEPRESVVSYSQECAGPEDSLQHCSSVAQRFRAIMGFSFGNFSSSRSGNSLSTCPPQEISTAVQKLPRESSGQYSDFSILSSLNSQATGGTMGLLMVSTHFNDTGITTYGWKKLLSLTFSVTLALQFSGELFESSALMHISAVKSLLSALCQLSQQCMTEASSGFGPAVSQKIGSISFSVERMISILVNNLHSQTKLGQLNLVMFYQLFLYYIAGVEPLWDQVLADNSNQHLRNMALDALDQSICAVLGSEQFQDYVSSRLNGTSDDMETRHKGLRLLECSVISPLRVLYFSTQSADVHAGCLKILLHVLERHGEKLYYSWPDILETLRSVADAPEKDLVALGFQSLRVIMNDGLTSIPTECLNVCVDVTGAYSAQKTELNISLTAIGLLWTTTDFIVKGLLHGPPEEKETSILDEHPILRQLDGELKEEQTPEATDKVNDQAPTVNIIDHDKLLFSVFSLLQRLGADERPEVRNAAVRTLFQTLGSHGQKLSKSMWEDCLWNYVFPALDRSSHMAATSSKDESQGKELGTRGGKAVHMLIHHSRNTVQKQWDETLVLVLGGIARLLRSFFPFLSSLSNFWSGWESLLLFVKNSILNGSKEVAIAGINCLQTTVHSHCLKGNLPMPYLISILGAYKHVIQKSTNYTGNAASKVKQEILHGLGELYVQAQRMFDDQMFSQLIGIIDLAIKQAITTNENFESEFGHVPPVLRTVLEILPLLHPTELISSMWLVLLRELLQYLPRSDSSLQKNDEEVKQASITDNVPGNNIKRKDEMPNGTASIFPKEAEAPPQGSGSTITVLGGIPSYAFAEKLVPVLIDLFLHAAAVEKYIIFPEIIQSLGRCMTTRRDNPDGSLWRVAVEGFNRVLADDFCKFTGNFGPDSRINRPMRTRVWKEIADVYEIFLVGYCGRAIPSNSLSAEALKADEALEMTILHVLGDKILKSPIDAPVDIFPGLLAELFFLSSYDNEAGDWSSTRSEVSKISIRVLLTRCEYTMNRFLMDEDLAGERPLPSARLEEIFYVLQELAHLRIHPETASVLPLHPNLKSVLADKEDHKKCPHLFVLFPTFCDLVITREARVRELVQVLLRLITRELSLEKVGIAS